MYFWASINKNRYYDNDTGQRVACQERHHGGADSRTAGLLPDGFSLFETGRCRFHRKGILAPDAEDQKAYLAAWDAYKNTDKIIVKFVPASGAASRMFKNLFEFLSAEYDKPTTKFEQAFFDGIKDFAFYDDLNVACQRTAGKDIPGLMEEGNYKAVVAALLETAGLNYGALPKGLLKFHKYPEGSRTPLEEHLAEGAMYAAGKVVKSTYTSLSLPNIANSSRSWWKRKPKHSANVTE